MKLNFKSKCDEVLHVGDLQTVDDKDQAWKESSR